MANAVAASFVTGGRDWHSLLGRAGAVCCKRVMALLAAVLVLPSTAMAGQHPLPALAIASAEPQGVFSSVRYVEEAGDLLGYELRFFHRDRRLLAEMVDCEGWCNASMVIPVARHGAGFEAICCDNEGQQGTPKTRLFVNWVGRRLALVVWQGGKPVTLLREDRLLAPRKRAYGLAVVHDMKADVAHRKKEQAP